MTIIRDGEKWACKQCIAGHRVSTCTHEERPLHHVARKGRPVSQCVHCRGLRKARAQHVKCDCGERRLSSASSHSRNNSSESASTTADENSCLCFQGKKCTCALKKEPGTFEPNLTVPRSGLAPFFDRDTGKPHIPNRRSENSVPRSRNTYQPGLERSGYSPQETRRPYHHLSSPLARGYHAAQRSVDSLPLFLNNTGPTPGQTAFPPTAFHQDNPFMHPEPRYLSPNSQQTHLGTTNLPEVPSFGNFSVEPLGETVLERTLSPRNPNRHSIGGTISGQWAALMDNNDVHRLGEHGNFEQIYGGGQVNETQGYPFASQTNQQWSGGWERLTQPQLHQQSHLGSHELASAGQFSHSRSSSGTVSEPHDPPSYNNSNHPTIQIDPSPTWTMGPDEKIWSAAYSEGPSDFNFSGDASLPQYSDDFSVTDHSEYDYSNYAFPAHDGSDSRNNSIDSVSPQQASLPDRSIQSEPYNTALAGLPQYKFPPESISNTTGDEMYENEQSQHYDWQHSGHDTYIKEEGNSPWNGYG